jgi:hypothetical protein
MPQVRCVLRCVLALRAFLPFTIGHCIRRGDACGQAPWSCRLSPELTAGTPNVFLSRRVTKETEVSGPRSGECVGCEGLVEKGVWSLALRIMLVQSYRQRASGVTDVRFFVKSM